MEILILFLLAIMNGALAMSELAVVSARHARLQKLADEGNVGASTALQLSNNPNQFLSAVQIGITLIGIIAGAFGGATLSEPMSEQLAKIDFLAPHSDSLGYVLVILITTYISLVFGELVPKRIAMQNPERVSSLVARPMRLISKLTYPFVWLLSNSTQLILRILRIPQSTDSAVTEEEIQMLLREGIQHGIFEESEEDMIAGVFRLDDLWVEALMTPRTQIVYLDIHDTQEIVYQKIAGNTTTRFPVVDGDIENVQGFVSTGAILRQLLAGRPFDLTPILQEPLIIPHSTPASSALSKFQEADTVHFALVIGEYGEVEGVLTINDIISTVVGEIDHADIIQRKDGSWLVDGLVPPSEFRAELDIHDLLPDEDTNLYHTVAGFMIHYTYSFPQIADTVDWNGYRFEVIDIDGRRIDKILVTKLPD